MAIQFRVDKIDENLYRLWDVAGDMMYLAVGTQSAALIDTGLGIGDLRACVEQLTDKPVKVLLTHGHMDHAMGAPDFDDVYMNPADDGLYAEQNGPDYRAPACRAFMGPERWEAVESEYRPSRPLNHKPLLPGMRFDLGGLTLEIYDGRGHTQGSVVILFVEKRILLLGDACNSNTLLLSGSSSSVGDYMAVMEKLRQDTQGKYDVIYFSHEPDSQEDYLSSMIDLCRQVLDGKSDVVPYDFMGEHMLLAKARDERFVRLDGGLANLAYTADKV